MLFKVLYLTAAVGGLIVNATAFAACPFNVAGNATADSMRDGVLLVRYAKGLRGAALVAGTGTGFTAATVEANIVRDTNQLDVNGNGVFDSDDAAIIARQVFGFNTAAWLPDGKAGAYATRTTTAKLKAFVDAGCLPPVVSAPTAEQIAASRFLIQSTFGPSRADIAAFLTLPGGDQPAKASAWIAAQSAMPRVQTHFQYLLTRKAEYEAAGKGYNNDLTREAFWGQALTSPDQLRQRLAFALSEILVVSSNGGSNNPHELAAYLDLLADNGFGNFRDLLYKVAMSPAMGRYLSHLRNDGGNTNPNENFAREIMQLFSVGLQMLGPDGVPILVGGAPVPTYDENTVKGFARVFTGLSFDDPYCKQNDAGYSIARVNCRDGYSSIHPDWNWTPDRTDIPANVGGELFPPVVNGWAKPMVPYAGRASPLAKQLLTYSYASPVPACTAALTIASKASEPGLLPAITDFSQFVTPPSGRAGTRVTEAQAMASINAAIDNIFCHPNVAPFMGEHLIRFFVTSTPTPAYVARVAAVFNNNGANIRGDMQAVLRAVLLDPEAQQPSATADMKFGKLKEPMLRLSAILRAFNARSSSGRYQIRYNLDRVESGISQSPLQSATVFNYFHPEFASPGPIANNNANGPEFEITTTTAIAATQNYFGALVSSSEGGSNLSFTNSLLGGYSCDTDTLSSGDPDAKLRQHCVFGDLSELFAMHTDSNAILDYLNLVMMGGSLNSSNKAALVTALDAAFPVIAAAPVLASTAPNPPTSAQIAAYNAALISWQVRKRNRVKGALWLVVHTPEFQIQR